MTTFKRMLRVAGFTLLIMLASMGVGLVGAILPSYRERYMDNETKTEQVDKKRNEQELEDIS